MTVRWLYSALFLFAFESFLLADFQKAAGSFQLNTSTGNQTISALGFQPKIIFLKWSGQTTTGTSAVDYSIGYGVAVSPSSRAAVYSRQVNGSLNADARHANNRCLVVINSSGTVTEAADLVSMNPDGFTINVTDATAAVRVSFEAWGGSSLTNVALVQFTTPTSTGTRQITGAGFAPDLAQFFTIGSTTAPPSTMTGGRFGFGFAASSTAQAGLGNSVLSSSSNDTGAQSVSKALYVPDTSAMYLDANVSSFDSDGVTLNFTTVQSSSVYAWAVLTKGLRAAVGSFTQPASAQSQIINSLSFKPEASFFATYCHAPATGQQATGKVSLGFSVSSTQQSANWTGANSGNNQAQQANFTDATIACYTASSSTPSLNSKAVFTSNDATGFTLNWSNANATQRQIVFMVVADSPATDVVAPLLITRAFVESSDLHSKRIDSR